MTDRSPGTPLALTRRATLLGLPAAVACGRAALAVAPGATQARLVVILLRGALDGLAAVAPYGEARLRDLRPALVPPPPGTPGGMGDLGGFFGLHPALGPLLPLYRSGEMLIVHATAGPYRVRSHFEAQDCLDCGASHRLASGWLNRAALLLPGGRGNPTGAAALSAGLSLPLLLRGRAPVATFAPETGAQPADDLFQRIAALNAADPALGPAMAAGLRARAFTRGIVPPGPQPPGSPFVFLADCCGRLLAADKGPRLAALELGGWDTHAAQPGRLSAALGELAAGLLALKQGLGAAWATTTVLTLTEFGRTVRQNGTEGTDHGTAGVAFVLGGKVAGGRVAGNWPGLTDLLDDRDLAPTTDVRAVAKAVLAASFGFAAPALGAVFPDSAGVTPMRGVMRA